MSTYNDWDDTQVLSENWCAVIRDGVVLHQSPDGEQLLHDAQRASAQNPHHVYRVVQFAVPNGRDPRAAARAAGVLDPSFPAVWESHPASGGADDTQVLYGGRSEQASGAAGYGAHEDAYGDSADHTRVLPPMASGRPSGPGQRVGGGAQQPSSATRGYGNGYEPSATAGRRKNRGPLIGLALVLLLAALVIGAILGLGHWGGGSSKPSPGSSSSSSSSGSSSTTSSSQSSVPTTHTTAPSQTATTQPTSPQHTNTTVPPTTHAPTNPTTPSQTATKTIPSQTTPAPSTSTTP